MTLRTSRPAHRGSPTRSKRESFGAHTWAVSSKSFTSKFEDLPRAEKRLIETFEGSAEFVPTAAVPATSKPGPDNRRLHEVSRVLSHDCGKRRSQQVWPDALPE